MSGFDNTLGALLAGLMFSLTLYGITVVQTYMYYATYQDDRRHIKYLVLSLFLLDTLDSVFISHALYILLVTRYDQPNGLMAAFENTWSISAGTLVTSIIAFLAQSFLGSRVWRLSGKNWFLLGLIATLSLVQFAFIVVFVAMCLLEARLFGRLNTMKWILLVPYGCAATCDTIITASLCWYLSRTPAYFERTQLLINKLIFYTVNTSLWTTIFVLLDLIAFVVWPTNLVYIGVFFLISKLYTNSLLAILNTRKSLRSTMLSTSEVVEVNNTIPLSRFSIRQPTTSTTVRHSVISEIPESTGDPEQEHSMVDLVPGKGL